MKGIKKTTNRPLPPLPQKTNRAPVATEKQVDPSNSRKNLGIGASVVNMEKTEQHDVSKTSRRTYSNGSNTETVQAMIAATLKQRPSMPNVVMGSDTTAMDSQLNSPTTSFTVSLDGMPTKRKASIPGSAVPAYMPVMVTNGKFGDSEMTLFDVLVEDVESVCVFFCTPCIYA